MPDRNVVIEKLEECLSALCRGFKPGIYCPFQENVWDLIRDAVTLLKTQEARHRLEVHNIGNVDVPEGVTWEQFQAVMNGVVAALEHTDRGEPWPYDEVKSDV